MNEVELYDLLKKNKEEGRSSMENTRKRLVWVTTSLATHCRRGIIRREGEHKMTSYDLLLEL